MSLGALDLLALAVQIGLLLLPVRAGLRLARALAASGAERWVVTLLAALGATLPVLLALGFLGLLRPVPIALGLGVACLALERLATRLEPEPAAEPVAGSREWRLLAWAVALPALALALLRGPWRWDDLTYHLFYPALWLERGALFVPDFPAPHVKAATFPGGGELLHALAMAIVGNDLLVAALGVGWVAMFGLATAALAREAGCSARAATVCGLLAATLPTVLSRAATGYVDGLLDFALVAAVLLVARLAREPASRLGRFALLAGIAGGVGAGVKYVGAPVAAALALAVVLVVGQRTRSAAATLRAAALFVLPVTILALPWYVRNLLLTGNPIWPAPLAGLPALDHPLYPWSGTSVAARFGELARSGVLSEALFALPRGAASMSLGWMVVALAPWTLIGGARGLVEGLRAARRGETGTATRAGLPVLGFALFGAIFLALPTWGNDGLFRSEVRFAAPAAALAVLLAVRELARLRRGSGTIVWLVGVSGVVLHVVQADLLTPLRTLAPVALLPLGMLAAGAFALGRWRRGGPAARWVASGLGAGLLLAGLGLAWVMREATRTATVVDPLGDGRPSAPGEMAVFVGELAAPAGSARRIAFAATVNYEFGYLLVGPRLGRSVEWIPPCADSARRAPGTAGAPCAKLDAASWRSRLERRGTEILVTSRWGLGDGRWPAEERWAADLGWPILAETESYRARAVGSSPRSAETSDGGRGGPQPDSQARAR